MILNSAAIMENIEFSILKMQDLQSQSSERFSDMIELPGWHDLNYSWANLRLGFLNKRVTTVME